MILRNNKNPQFSTTKKLGIFDDFTNSGSPSHIMEFCHWHITISEPIFRNDLTLNVKDSLKNIEAELSQT